MPTRAPCVPQLAGIGGDLGPPTGHGANGTLSIQGYRRCDSSSKLVVRATCCSATQRWPGRLSLATKLRKHRRRAAPDVFAVRGNRTHSPASHQPHEGPAIGNEGSGAGLCIECPEHDVVTARRYPSVGRREFWVVLSSRKRRAIPDPA